MLCILYDDCYDKFHQVLYFEKENTSRSMIIFDKVHFEGFQ